MKKEDQKLLLGIAIGAAAAFVFMRHAAAAAPVFNPVRSQHVPVLPQQIELQAMTGTGVPRYTRRGRAMLAAIQKNNYLKQPGYPMPGWMA